MSIIFTIVSSIYLISLLAAGSGLSRREERRQRRNAVMQQRYQKNPEPKKKKQRDEHLRVQLKNIKQACFSDYFFDLPEEIREMTTLIGGAVEMREVYSLSRYLCRSCNAYTNIYN